MFLNERFNKANKTKRDYFKSKYTFQNFLLMLKMEAHKSGILFVMQQDSKQQPLRS